MTARRALCAGFAVLFGSACAPSESEVKHDFEKVVASSNACVKDEDCVSASADCPLGCSVAVNRQRKDFVERRARELIDDYERWGRGCEYDCAGQGPPICKDKKCAFGELPDPNATDAGTTP